MTYFLDRIASHIHKNYGSSLEKQLLVFPNIRAGLYFLKYLSSNLDKPVWAPSVKTINELFKELSPYRIAENEQLIFELYRIYRKLNPLAESFDDFYFWGEMLLNDFDDADKYLADAESLFSTVRDIKKIDAEFGNLTPEQANAVRQFWVNFEPEKATKQKDDFLELWKILPQIYKQFRQTIIDKNLVYEGIVYRDIAEKCRNGNSPDLKWETVHFIGFNALNACEKILMKSLKRAGSARFYWDYDLSYIEPGTSHSAGFFIRQNLEDFGNDMPGDWNYTTYVSDPPGSINRTIIETTSDVSQVKLLPEILKGIKEINGPDAHHTALVLADENLLVPLISSIPDFVSDINITMGYPLKFSPVYSLVRALINLQLNSKYEGETVLFDHQDVISLLKHSYLNSEAGTTTDVIIESLTKDNKQWVPAGYPAPGSVTEPYLRKVDNPDSFNKWISEILKSLFISSSQQELTKTEVFEVSIRNEFIYKTLLAINRLDLIVRSFDVEIRNVTYFRLLDKVLRSLSVPFSGEPLNGIQIMGILETRALDFRNLVIFSVNEGKLPKSSTSSSFIPYNLREAFGLPTIRHQDSIYAYYFYRLLERSENVIFIYNSNSEGLRTGEKSRLLMQLDYLTKTSPGFSSAGYIFQPQSKVNSIVQKTETVINKLKQTYTGPGKKALSPSAVNTWLNCRMKFYYKYVCGLKEPEKILTEIDPALFGEMLHDVMKKVYTPFLNTQLSRETILKTIKDKEFIEGIVCETLNSKYPQGRESQSGNDMITCNILTSYVRLILDYDAGLDGLSINSLERNENATVNIVSGDETLAINVGGITDRIDSVNGVTRIVDYKTGNVAGKISSVNTLFETDGEKGNDAWFQLLMYCEIFSVKNNGKVYPSLYCLRRISDPDYSDALIIKDSPGQEISLTDYRQIRDEFAEGFRRVLASVFDMNENFEMTSNTRLCEYCFCRKLCQR